VVSSLLARAPAPLMVDRSALSSATTAPSFVTLAASSLLPSIHRNAHKTLDLLWPSHKATSDFMGQKTIESNLYKRVQDLLGTSDPQLLDIVVV